MDILNILQQIVSNPANTILCNEGTMFETSYPKIVVDCLSTENKYLNIDTLENLDSVKILKVKNQKTDKFFAANPKDIKKVISKDGNITFKYLLDGKEKQMTI